MVAKSPVSVLFFFSLLQYVWLELGAQHWARYNHNPGSLDQLLDLVETDLSILVG